MSHTKELHIISGELNILKWTLTPLYEVIKALREHSGEKLSGNAKDGSGQSARTAKNQAKMYGADISAATRVYLADVADHVLILSEQVDMLKSTVENMINMVPISDIYADQIRSLTLLHQRKTSQCVN
jgi:Mg2+ and Co2+ transporter CorA